MNLRYEILRKGYNKFLLLMIIACSIACKKEDFNKGNPSSIQVLNALENNIILSGTFGDARPMSFNFSPQIRNRSLLKFSFENTVVQTSFYALPDTLEKDQPVFKMKFDVEQSKAYTLFLIGPKTQVDHLLTPLEYKPFEFEDSLSFCRIVNMSNDNPVSINLKGNASGSLVSQLAFKQYSNFIQLPFKIENKLYELEIRDATTGELLNTYILKNEIEVSNPINVNLYKYWSLVLLGKRTEQAGSKLELVRMNH